MKFKKKVLFLGIVQNVLKDGTVYYTLQFFDQDSGPVSVNVMSNHPCVPAMEQAKFGDQMDITFVLRPKDKLYKLGIA